MTQHEDDAARLARELAEAAHPFTKCIVRKGGSDEDRAMTQLASDAMTRAYRSSDIIATLPIIRARLAERDARERMLQDEINELKGRIGNALL